MLCREITAQNMGFGWTRRNMPFYSGASFCRYIKQRTSKSFVDFLTDIRLGFAIRALIDSSQSVAEIGYACGFNNLSNFNRIFKKKKGMPPTEVRENYRKKKVIV